jgi:hypothetical protein
MVSASSLSLTHFSRKEIEIHVLQLSFLMTSVHFLMATLNCFEKLNLRQTRVAQACNPSYSAGRVQEYQGLKAASGKQFKDLSQESFGAAQMIKSTRAPA